jgi:transcriptional regulator with XRE-family HTH domain
MAHSARGNRKPEQIAFGASLRLLRTKTGWRQHEAAAAAGITKAMLSSYETGLSYPSLVSLFSILRALGADFRDLQNSIDALSGREGQSLRATGGPALEELARSRLNQLQREQEIGKAVLAIVAMVQAKPD